MSKENPSPSPATLYRVALENLGNIKGDPDVVEELGISTDPDTLKSRIASGREVARILGQTGTVAELEPGQPATPHDNPKYGPDWGAWRKRSNKQKNIDETGIKKAKAALEEGRKRSKEQ